MTFSRAGPIALTAVLLTVTGAPARAQERSSEPVLKAEFIERFTRFIDWPREVLASSGIFRLCVVGSTPVALSLEQLARTRQFKGHAAYTVRLVALDGLSSCHLVFIDGSERRRLDDILSRTAGKPILTVGDTVGYSARGVIINFYRSGSRLRFEINIAAALESGLRFRSKLLKLARVTGVDDGALR